MFMCARLMFRDMDIDARVVIAVTGVRILGVGGDMLMFRGSGICTR